MQLNLLNEHRTGQSDGQLDVLLGRVEMMRPRRTTRPSMGWIGLQQHIRRLGARMVTADGRQRRHVQQAVIIVVVDA